ncbi:MAG: hypothetical protein CFE21_02595 [Bacteroidetes bacterium B1(2017)]|nr:MAG: hypothetical protein CFE21_02595 [Bacteroidetes bacterium B1(2017)]
MSLNKIKTEKMDIKYEKTIVEVLHILRGMAQLKQKEVAEKLGIHTSAYWKMENGLVSLNLRQFRDLCTVFGYSHTKIYLIIDLLCEMRQTNPNLDIRVQIFKCLYLDDMVHPSTSFSTNEFLSRKAMK